MCFLRNGFVFILPYIRKKTKECKGNRHLLKVSPSSALLITLGWLFPHRLLRCHNGILEAHASTLSLIGKTIGSITYGIADCADFFEYQADGKILPSQVPNRNRAAQETIQRLQLNISKLTSARARSI
jgi:hypothetical protein